MKNVMTALALLIGVTGLAAQSADKTYPPAFPRTNATKLHETDRFVVWDIVWPKGQPTAMHRHVYDQLGTYYARGGRLITMPDGTSRPSLTETGSLSTTKKGTTHIEEGTTVPPLRAVFIELKKEGPSGLPEVSRDLPPAFPRADAKQLLDDERATIWEYTWKPGAPRFTYRAGRDTVIVYLGDGTVTFTPQNGAPGTLEASPGRMRYLARGSVETEEGAGGAPRAIVFELK